MQDTNTTNSRSGDSDPGDPIWFAADPVVAVVAVVAVDSWDKLHASDVVSGDPNSGNTVWSAADTDSSGAAGYSGCDIADDIVGDPNSGDTVWLASDSDFTGAACDSRVPIGLGGRIRRELEFAKTG